MANIDGTSADDTLTGTSDADVLRGFGGADQIFGLAGNDVLDGGSGFDDMTGGAGDDLYIADNNGERAIEEAGGGYDVIYTSDSFWLNDVWEIEGLVALDWNATTALELIGNALDNYIIGNAGANRISGAGGADILVGKGGDDTYVVDNAGDRVFEEAGGGYDRIETFISYALNDASEVEELIARAASVNLAGNALDNRLVGGFGGTNILDGGAGADTMIGAEGENSEFDSSDIYYVDNFGDVVVETSDTPDPDEVRTSLTSYSLAGTKIEYLTGLGNIAQTLTGSAFANVIDGGAGADTMTGGLGNDIYLVDNGGDTVVELAGEGMDEVRTSFASYTLSATLENLTGTSALGQTLIGNAADNVILAGAGADVVNGGAGADRMAGGAGDDVYIVDSAGDTVVEVLLEGSDAVYASVSYALDVSGYVETLSTLDWNSTVSINLTGNGLNNYLIGNAGANVLDGKGGTDILVGKGGNDIYIGDDAADQVFENAGEGADAVYTSAGYTLAAGSEVETLSTLVWSATTPIDLTGNAIANYLIGNAGANVLNGGAGNDALVGREGADTFAFTTALGAGNVDHIADMVSGTDKIALDDAVFTGLAPGALSANAFVVGNAAGDADDRIIYNSATGQLFFDADGNGAGAAVLFAIVDGAPVLAASDFTVI